MVYMAYENVFHWISIDGCFTDTSVTTHENLMFHKDFQSVFMATKVTSAHFLIVMLIFPWNTCNLLIDKCHLKEMGLGS